LPAFAQQDSTRPKKILPPEQQAMQQQMREVGAKRSRWRQAKQALDAEMRGKKAAIVQTPRTLSNSTSAMAKRLGLQIRI
jgi:hypothetical protein